MKPAEPAGVASRSASAPSPAAPPALMRLLRAQAGEWIHRDTPLLCLPPSVPSAPDKAVVPTTLSRTTAASAGEGSRWRRSRPGPPPPRRPVRGERTRRSRSASRARGAPETRRRAGAGELTSPRGRRRVRAVPVDARGAAAAGPGFDSAGRRRPGRKFSAASGVG